MTNKIVEAIVIEGRQFTDSKELRIWLDEIQNIVNVYRELTGKLEALENSKL